MNKNGFIATSLLYSFFLVFCAMILGFSSLIATNSIAISKQIDSVNEDLHTKLKIKDAKIGTYFTLNTCSKSALFSPNEKMLYYLINTSDEASAVFLSKDVSYKLSNLDFLKDVLDKIYIKMGDTKYFSRSMGLDDYDVINSLTDNDLKTMIKNLNDGTPQNQDINYLIANNNNVINAYVGSEVYNTKSATKSAYSADGDILIFIRNAFDIDKNVNIISGKGTLKDPYILEGGATECDKE